MSLVKMKTKGQVTIPAKMRRDLGIVEETLLEASAKEGVITLRPQRILNEVDISILKGLEDIKAGRISPAFSSSKEMDEYLNKEDET